MPMQTTMNIGIRPVDRPQAPGGAEGVQRRGDGGSSSAFSPRTHVAIQTAVDDMAGILSKISQHQDDTIERMPEDLQKVVQNVLKQAFSMNETLSRGIGSTLESQRFSMEQLTALSRMLHQLGNLVDKGFSTDFGDDLSALLKNFKNFMLETEGAALEPVLLNKAAFELLDTKTLEELPDALKALIAASSVNVGTVSQMQSGEESSLGFLKQLVQFFMPKPTGSGGESGANNANANSNTSGNTNSNLNTGNQANNVNNANNTNNATNSNANNSQNLGSNTNNNAQNFNNTNNNTNNNFNNSNQTANSNNANSGGQGANNAQNANTNANSNNFANNNANANNNNGQMNANNTQNNNQNNAQNNTQNNAQNANNNQTFNNTNSNTNTNVNTNTNTNTNTNANANANANNASNSGQFANSNANNSQNAGNNNLTSNSGANSPQANSNFNANANANTNANANNNANFNNNQQGFSNSNGSSEYVPNLRENLQNRYLKPNANGVPASPTEAQKARVQLTRVPIQNTPQAMETMKNMAQLLLKNNPSMTEADQQLLQNFVNGREQVMEPREVRQLQTLLRLCQQNVPTTLQQAAVQQNLPDLPRLWAFMTLCDLSVAKRMTGRQLKKAGKEVADLVLSMRHSMSGTNREVEGQRSLNFMMPLYMEGEEKAYPSYIHVYDENEEDPNTGEMKKETWLRLCVLTDNIGAVELTCRIYGDNALDMRLFFSSHETAEEFRDVIPEFLGTLGETKELMLNEIKVGAVDERRFL